MKKSIISILTCGVLVTVMLSGCTQVQTEEPAPAQSKATKTQEAQPETSPAEVAVPDTQKEVEEKDGLTDTQKALLASLVKEAEDRISKGGNMPEVTVSPNTLNGEYPAAFDLRNADRDGDGVTENYVTSIKEQHPFGTCWAFASISAAETSILYELGQEAIETSGDGTRKDTIDLSEHHLAWFTYTPLPEGDSQAGEGLYSQVEGIDENPSMRMNSGSTQFAASSVFASGMGPLQEPDFLSAEWPESGLNYHGREMLSEKNASSKFTQYSAKDDWSVDESLRFKQSYMLEDIYFLPPSATIGEDGEYDYAHAELAIKDYKEQLINGRAVSIAYHSDNYFPGRESASPQYINTKEGTWAHYCYEPVTPNHAVTVIGWDDSYPASMFMTEVQDRDEEGNLLTNEDGSPKMKTVAQPEKDGAWIVKNSWGSTDPITPGYNYNEWGIDGSGYFYLSYWDKSLESAQCFDFDVENRLKADLGKYVIDEYDCLPVEQPHSVSVDREISTANAFNAEADITVKAVSCTTTKAGEELIFRAYILPDGKELSTENLTLVSEATKSFPSAGLHVVPLTKPFDVKENQKYLISITQKSDDGYLFSVGSEYNKKGYDAGYCDDRYAAVGVVNPGESYIYIPDEDIWWDFSEAKAILEGMEGATSYITYDNFPIKAYASFAAE